MLVFFIVLSEKSGFPFLNSSHSSIVNVILIVTKFIGCLIHEISLASGLDHAKLFETDFVETSSVRAKSSKANEYWAEELI